MAWVLLIVAWAFRSVGRILNTMFGWATTTLFGKVPQNKRIHVTIISSASVAWIIVAIAIVFPSFFTFLMSFFTIPRGVARSWIRWTMVVLVIIIPFAVGYIGILIQRPSARPKGTRQTTIAILKGVTHTVGLALTMIMMTTLVPIMKVHTVIRRWKTTHIPVTVHACDYLDVVARLQQILAEHGLMTRQARATWFLRWPTAVLAFFTGGAIEHLVASRLSTLKAPHVEVIIHPADLVIQGKRRQVLRTHALITEHLLFSKAYMTWDETSNRLEDRIRAIWYEAQAHFDRGAYMAAVTRLRGFDHTLREADIPHDEWEILFREKLIIERALLERVAGIGGEPRDLSEIPPEDIIAAGHAQPGGVTVPLLPLGAAAAALALLTWVGFGLRRLIFQTPPPRG